MGLFHDIGKVMNFIPHTLEKVERPLTSSVYHKITGTPTSKEARKQQELMNEQIAAYKQETEISRNEMNMAKDAQNAEKRRIQEKQIRSLRSHSSKRGFLGSSGDELDPGINSKLGI